MTRQAITSFEEHVEKWWWSIIIVAGLFILLWLYQMVMQFLPLYDKLESIAELFLEEFGKDYLLGLLQDHIHGVNKLEVLRKTLGIIASFLFKTFLTVIVGSDWMLKSSVDEWRIYDQDNMMEMNKNGEFCVLENNNPNELYEKRDSVMKTFHNVIAGKWQDPEL